MTLNDHVKQDIPELRLVHNLYGSMDTITLGMLLWHSAGFPGPTWPYKRGKPWERFEPTGAQLVAIRRDLTYETPREVVQPAAVPPFAIDAKGWNRCRCS